MTDGGGPLADPRRPAYHLSPPQGWMNDPYGVTWCPQTQDYVLFAQHWPHAPAFDPRMSWLAARSPDLVHWSAPEVVLAPRPPDAGCWSGTAVPTAGGLRLLYTGVDGTGPDGSWRLGRVVATTLGDTARRDVLVAGPPTASVTDFRDPYLLPGPDGWWRMVLGAGDAGRGAVFGYSSEDLETWTYDGVLARAGDSPERGGAGMWECPQLIEVDGAWVLIVSVGDDGPDQVRYSVGDLAWPTFRPGPFRPLWAGVAAYATTAFADRDGAPTVISWLRESGALDRTWAGVQSLPARLTRAGDVVRPVPHPAVDGIRGAALWSATPEPGGRSELGPVGPYADLDVSVEPAEGDPARLSIGDLDLEVSGDGGVRVRRDGTEAAAVPAPRDRPTGAHRVRCLLDASVAEVYGPGGAAPLRIDPLPAGTPVTADPGGPSGVRLRVTCHALSPRP